jgi:hypothetical protein
LFIKNILIKIRINALTKTKQKSPSPVGGGLFTVKNQQTRTLKKIYDSYSKSLVLRRHSGIGKKYLPPTTTTNGVKPVIPEMPCL